MSAHEEHFAGSNKLFTSIWVWLLILTLVEIFLAYKPMPIHFMLVVLLGLSLIKAALIIAYFMHLKFERLSDSDDHLCWSSVLACCLCFPDRSVHQTCVISLRNAAYGPPRSTVSAVLTRSFYCCRRRSLLLLLAEPVLAQAMCERHWLVRTIFLFAIHIGVLYY